MEHFNTQKINKTYRTDIDGLRAIAVFSVILFHLGYLKNGYLGVDIFFVISGYLITGIVYTEVTENRFSVLKFYERRIRRIIPLVLFTSIVAFLIGFFYMLPDDLENLCQSIFASNFSANNILMKITSSDYWAVNNEYKPLMHTWSLGVEEQFYIFYPIIFYFLNSNKKKYILPILIFLTAISLILFISTDNTSSKFYFLQYRFFELSIGGISAISFKNITTVKNSKTSKIILIILLLLLLVIVFSDVLINNDIKVISTTLLTTGVLILGNYHFNSSKIYKYFIANNLIVWIGKISFSLYMWHQIVFAFARYISIEHITIQHAFILSFLVIILSIFSYYFIETPFRNRNIIKTKSLLIIVSTTFIIITSSSLYVYIIGGIVRDVPELGITKTNRIEQLNFFSSQNNINIQYNENVRKLDIPFSSTKDNNKTKIKILVVGNSFGRDLANILNESSFKDSIEVRYSDLAPLSENELRYRFKVAEFIYFGSNYPSNELIKKYGIDMSKVWAVGIKDFGNSNGINYNRKIKDFTTYRCNMKKGILELNLKYKKDWGERYIDLIDLIADEDGRVLVFTPEGKFISQDTGHLTKFGAVFFGKLLDSKFRTIMKL